MKRFFICLLLVLLAISLLLVTGLIHRPHTVENWVEVHGIAWDRDGTLLEMPLTIPDCMHYAATGEFDGDLLLWSVDDHLLGVYTLELCVVELDTGTVTAQRDVAMSQYAMPQVLGDTLYLCDSTSGQILALDKTLSDVNSWIADPCEGTWYMGSNEILYVLADYTNLYRVDLKTGERVSVLEGNPYVQYVIPDENMLQLEYYRNDTGAPECACLDLLTGEVQCSAIDGTFSSVSADGSTWLCGFYEDSYIYYLSLDGAEPVRVAPGGGILELLDGDYILHTSEDNAFLTLYDRYGNALSRCQVSEMEYGYDHSALIWSDYHNGYFVPISDYSGCQRLLFWDISRGDDGEDLDFQPIPEPSEAEILLRQRARELGEKYGVTIYVASECDTVFDEFTATLATDFDHVNAALDTLDSALAAYPEGFIRQLRYDTIHGIRIHLISDLQADGSGRYGGGYNAFTQPQWDHYLMVMDIDDSSEQTYYHEFSHIIDSYLEWDSINREGALYSEATWVSMNPSWFDGYSYDYSNELYLNDFTYFTDSYATVSPTEDRARIMEYAMAEYGYWTFADAPGLQKKLDYYCRCIRDAFDTSGWPEVLPWEQYIS